ncbi:MAG TPA: hypothetical protein VK249_08665 [Anaerolineales bacterium]|nr:hypothetical protein [Anaerolineales bacterium]
MPATNLPDTLLKIGLALAKHQVKNAIGDEALEIVATTFADVGGEKVQAKVDSIFASKEGQKQLINAAKAADGSFKAKCKDNDLCELFTMGYGDLPSVQEAIAKLPEAFDDESLRETLFKAFRNDAPKRISDEQINEGINLYIECLQSALIPVKDFGLRIIHNALKEIGRDVKEIKGDVKSLLEQVNRQQPYKRIISFNTLIAEKTKDFVGRQFVFDALDTFLSEEKSGYFVIRGEPGIGKTALMGQLVKTRNLIHHFNVIQQNIRLPELFLGNVCAQLIDRYKLDLKIPDEPMGSSVLLEQCLHQAAANSANHPIIIALDSLDEAEWRLLPPRVNVHFLPPILPEGVYVVVTTRPDKDIPLHVISRRDLDIEPDLEGNLLDILVYLENYVKRSEMQERLNAWNITDIDFVAELLQKSQGNFMYLRYVLPVIEAGKLGQGGVGELPKGLEAYYQSHWAQMKEEIGGNFKETHEKVICVLAVMTEPVSLDEVSDWTKIERRKVSQIVQAWEPFLLEDTSTDGRLYRLYHASFADFLAKQVDLRNFSELVATAIEAKIERARQG